jgi:hypothetical protein
MNAIRRRASGIFLLSLSAQIAAHIAIATGARQAFNVSAYPNAPLVDFRFDHLDIEAKTAGTIANAKDWTLTESDIRTADGSMPTFSDTSVNDPSDKAYGDR